MLTAHREWLASGGEIITATARQAQALRAALGRHAHQAGHEVWETPRISHYSAWLEAAYRTVDERRLLLDPYAQLRLWQWVIERSEVGQGLVAIPSTAREAARTWGLVQDWQIPLNALTTDTPEESAFRGWAQAFVQRTHETGSLDPARLVREVTAVLEQRPIGERAPIAFHGFTDETPARRSLADALVGTGHSVRTLGMPSGACLPVRYEAASSEAEAEAIIQWLLECYARMPQGRFAVIVPDLAQRLPVLERLLADRFMQADVAVEAFPIASSVNRSLSESAVVDTALALLALGGSQIEVLRVGQLLRSPYLAGDAKALCARAQMDVSIRRLGCQRLRTDRLATVWDESRHVDATFLNAVAATRRALSADTTTTAADWADRFQRALRAAGWPGPRGLSSVEYHAAHALTEALAVFGRLSPLVGSLGMSAALAEFRGLVRATTLPSRRPDPSVWLLDRWEDPGLPLDGLWVAGLSAEAFPAPPAPSPFLSLALQRQLQMPGASAAHRLTEAQHALSAWCRSAPRVVLSVPQYSGETAVVPSRLMQGAPLRLPYEPTPSRAQRLFGGVLLDRVPSGVLSAYAPGSALPNGTGLVQRQAECPFWASAELRLAARALETPQPGLPRRVRGEIAHEAMRLFWSETRDHARLCALSEEALRQAVVSAVTEATRAQTPVLPDTRLLRLECAWLTRVMQKWLMAERSRHAFTVLECEQPHEVNVAGFMLSVRIDRVDQLSDGSTVILDYKTGQRDTRKWLGPRPNPAQLPFYAAHRQPPPEAVALAMLSTVKQSFAGLAARDDLLPSMKGIESLRRDAGYLGRDWASVIAEWQNVTTELVRTFASGESSVDPAPGACERCQLSGVCRIPSKHDVSALDSEDGDIAEGES